MLHRTIPNSTPRTQTTVAMGFVDGMLAGLRRRGIDAGARQALAEFVRDLRGGTP